MMAPDQTAIWILKAENDLKVAKVQMKQPKHDVVTDAVCFHCQQAVEKFLKAFLTKNKIEFGRTHNLEFLVQLCTKINKKFVDLDVGNLTQYAVEIRYPDDFYEPTVEEAREALEIAKKVERVIKKNIKGVAIK